MTSAEAREPVGELRRSFSLRVLAAVGGLVATFLTTVIAVRALDPAEAAVFLSILAALMLGPMIGRFGLGQNVMRTLASLEAGSARRDSAGVHVRIALLFATVTAPVVAVASTAGLIGSSTFVVVTVLTALLIVLESGRLMLSDVFAAVGDVKRAVLTTHHARSIVVLPALLVVVLLSSRPTLTEMLIAYSIASVVPVLLVAVSARRTVGMKARAPRGTLGLTIAAGIALFSVDGALFVVNRANVWLASAQFEPVQAAQFSTASTLAFQVMVLEGLASLAITPIAARMWGTGRRVELMRLLRSVSTLATLVTLVAIVVLAAVGPWLLTAAYGADYAAAYPLLVILSIGGLGKAALGLNITLLMVLGRLRRAAFSAAAVLAVAVPVAIAAALVWGPIGLAIATAVASIALSLFQWVAARGLVPPELGLPAPRPSWRIGAAVREVRSSAPGSQVEVA